MSTPTDPNVQTIENAALDDVRPGDHVVWEESDTERGVTSIIHREGVAHDRDSQGDWCTEEGLYITAGEGEDVTLTIRRPVQDLPTRLGSTIVTNDEGGAIEALSSGIVWRAPEAILGADGRWHGVWRRVSGSGAIPSVAPERIIPNTWKEEE